MQGVGFRPFVKRLADRLGVPGIAFNTAGGLIIEIDAADEGEAASFLAAVKTHAPKAAQILHCKLERLPEPSQYIGFQIVSSAARNRDFTLIPADLATCQDCLAELQDPLNRRYGYPFTNCTNCGPRYSITLSTPYDRVNTTMQRFPLCADCAREYADPADRRFHAEPVACPICGPALSQDPAAIRTALKGGLIVALKGLGGFQLACHAHSSDAVERLRLRKRRSRKPFALMLPDLATVRRYCRLSQAEERALLTPAAPIVLLQLLDPQAFPPAVAPGLREVGVMLPYTPLHHLLFTEGLACLVMTSGNISEEPIVISNEEAQAKLSALADQLVTHNRDIFMRVDDSVERLFEDIPRALRRARGFAPEAIPLAADYGEILACGAELKNTFCLTKDNFAILSQHIGDLENFETLQFFEETLRNLQAVYQAAPGLIAHDLHPDYLSTRWALTRPEPKVAVQHHHAHVASCMAENGLSGPVIGVALDGTGFGSDGQIWGGEFLLCDFAGFERAAHLRYVPVPGGDRAARQPWRMAAAHLFDALGPGYRSLDLPCWSAASSGTWNVVDKLMARPAILTSSCGRLFDAVAAICGLSLENSYEGESAMLLEAASAGAETEDVYNVRLDTGSRPWTVDTREMLVQLARDVSAGRSPLLVGRCFHNAIALMIDVVCSRLRERNGLDRVCLSGGAFQNFTLLTSAVRLLRAHDFQVFLHAKVPPNDGGISLGQALVAAHSLPEESRHVPRNPR